jgi:hypothetical protein
MTHLIAVAASIRREPSDVRQEQISVLDIARGIAILGTLATNVWILIDPAGIIGYLQRPLPSLTGGLDQTVQTLARQLANGKFLGMLTLMFGGWPGTAAPVGMTSRPAHTRDSISCISMSVRSNRRVKRGRCPASPCTGSRGQVRR